MAYSSQSDVQIAVGGLAKLVQLTNGTAGTPVAATVTAAIAEADGEINSAISKRFLVPVSPVPDTLKYLSIRWAARVLRRQNNVPLPTDIDAEDIDRKMLASIAKGEISLGVEPIPAKGSIVTDKAAVRDTTKSVSRDKLKGWW